MPKVKVYDNYPTNGLAFGKTLQVMHAVGEPSHIVQFTVYISAASKNEAIEIAKSVGDRYTRPSSFRIGRGNALFAMTEAGLFDEPGRVIALGSGGQPRVVDVVSGEVIGRIHTAQGVSTYIAEEA